MFNWTELIKRPTFKEANKFSLKVNNDTNFMIKIKKYNINYIKSNNICVKTLPRSWKEFPNVWNGVQANYTCY